MDLRRLSSLTTNDAFYPSKRHLMQLRQMQMNRIHLFSLGRLILLTDD